MLSASEEAIACPWCAGFKITLAVSLQKSFRESRIYVLRTLLLFMKRLLCSSVVILLRGEELGLNLCLAFSPSSTHGRILQFGMLPFVIRQQIVLHGALL